MSVSIVSPEEEVWRGEAEMVIARSPEGEFAILNDHVPFLAALVPGRVSIVSGTERAEYFVSGGFLEASRGSGSAGPQKGGSGSAGPQKGGVGSASDDGGHDYHVIVLADGAEDLSQIDAAEARRRLEEAQAEAAETSDERAEARMRVEMARVQLAESGRGSHS